MTTAERRARLLARLPVVGQLKADLRKGASRLEHRTARTAARVRTDRQFLATVWARDAGRCRWCLRRVRRTLARVADRGEVHHLHGRRGAFRAEARCALLVCLGCHEKLTGRVNERWILVSTTSIRIGTQTCPDARAPITFERIA